MFDYCLTKHAGWWQIHKLLIQYKHKSARPLFSERNGYIKFIPLYGTGYRVSIRLVEIL